MPKWIEIASENLLNKSEEKIDFNIARLEWYFTGEVIDNNEDIDFGGTRPSCELCEHEDLRWQFTIINKFNVNELKVGSTCIKKFDIVLIDDNIEMRGEDRDKILNKNIRDKIKENDNKKILIALEQLCILDIKFKGQIEEAIRQWKKNKAFSPKMLSLIIWRFKINKKEYKSLKFKINLLKSYYKEDLRNMEKFKYDQIREYLTNSQQEKYDIV
ncbi:hypothetical protein AGMMS49546_38930 [Spirochaetia bacterium]|nr:hypothetical protein AGMMS49546_38930 [Spirochaetia bacterium]